MESRSGLDSLHKGWAAENYYMFLADGFGGKYHATHFWSLICLSMGILAENDRTHLGPNIEEPSHIVTNMDGNVENCCSAS